MIFGLSDSSLAFPDISNALQEPNGLLAVGGDLSVERLLAAYQQGIFPWFERGQPILWWSPDPRMVLFPAELHLSRSLRRTLRKQPFTVSANRDFAGVIRGCAAPRDYTSETWITPAMQDAYLRLHDSGFAHSVEVREGDDLVGGLYGLDIGGVFFGESMFSRRDEASKIAFVYLVKHLQAWDYRLIDCQVSSEHLAGFGAREIDRNAFRLLLPNPSERPQPARHWATFPASQPLPEMVDTGETP